MFDSCVYCIPDRTVARKLCNDLHSLKKLNLANNRIAELPSEFLCALPSLELLDLSDNPLGLVPPSSAALRELAGLSLISNSTSSYSLVLLEQPTAEAQVGIGAHLKQLSVVLLANCSLGGAVSAPTPSRHPNISLLGPATLRRHETPRPSQSPLETLGFLLDLNAYAALRLQYMYCTIHPTVHLREYYKMDRFGVTYFAT